MKKKLVKNPFHGKPSSTDKEKKQFECRICNARFNLQFNLKRKEGNSQNTAEIDDTIDIVSISWDLMVLVSISVLYIFEFTPLSLSLSIGIDYSNPWVFLCVSVKFSLPFVVKVLLLDSVLVSISWDLIVTVSESKLETVKSLSQCQCQKWASKVSVSKLKLSIRLSLVYTEVELPPEELL